ncbi:MULTISPECIES: hypothetical protein [Planococcus]|jgi:hypothetical protein|uniref:DUF5067 domain-containing protein n=2 Tax=Planococcus TaxID=1372 RepID=A0ABR8WDM3_9BACL|nr:MULTISPECIES: hypothetical protein [Planococcus]MBD8015130.1 hypothetical protein [Planococcus wigleyi]MDN3439449.1 hypothetical protein [Planococcus sp. APC 3900]
MKKKLLFALLCILVIGVGYTVFYVNQYSVKDNRASILADLTTWESRGSEEEIEIKILKMTQINHTTSYVVLFETADKYVGYAHLLKGWNGQFKIVESGAGTNIVKYRDLKTNQGVYGILAGKNPDLQIDHITAKSEFTDEDFSFTSPIPEDATFLVYKKLPEDLKETFLTFTLYDENGKVIEPASE